MAGLSRQDLEKVLKSRIKPMIDSAMERSIGAKVSDIEDDITSRLSSPVLDMEIDTSLTLKKAKQGFRKKYVAKLLQANFCNMSKVAGILGIDRRSMHRIINELRISQDKISQISSTSYNSEEEVRGIIESALTGYTSIIRPEKLDRMYREVPVLSKDIAKELPKAPLTMKEAEHEFEKRFISSVVNECRGKLSEAAKKLGIRYETLHRKIKKLGLS